MPITLCKLLPTHFSSGAALTTALVPSLAAMTLQQPVAAPSGFATLAAVAAEVVMLCTGLAGLYLTGCFVFSFAQANLEAAGGRSKALAEAQDRILPPIVCFLIAACAQALGSEITALASAAPVLDAAGALLLWRAIAEFVVHLILFSAGAVLVISFATNGLAAEVALFGGRPNALSELWTRLLLAAISGGLTLLSVDIARWIIELVIRSVPGWAAA